MIRSSPSDDGSVQVGTTGLMTRVTYTSGVNLYYADYFYDSLARVTKITDWINGTNGLRYGYARRIAQAWQKMDPPRTRG